MSASNKHPFQSDLYYTHRHRIASVTAGTDLDYSPSFYARSKPVLISFQLANDANSANRLVSLIYEIGGVDYTVAQFQYATIANETERYIATTTNIPDITASVYGNRAALPDIFVLGYSDAIKTSISGIQVADQITDVCIFLAVQPDAQY